MTILFDMYWDSSNNKNKIQLIFIKRANSLNSVRLQIRLVTDTDGVRDRINAVYFSRQAEETASSRFDRAKTEVQSVPYILSNFI